MKWVLVALLVLVGLVQLLNRTSPVILGPGVMAPDAPVQRKPDAPASYRVGDYTIQEVMDFRIHAKVLARENYYFGNEADLSPVDLALGWGNMSDERILEQISISQSNRFYRWWVEDFPIPRREIETSSANMHLIPADDTVRSVLDQVRPGDIVEISGSLVNVTADDGWRWTSSLTRNDTGRGACELIRVESLMIVTP